MANFELAIKEVLKYEGGYSNDPTDTGGETNFGISKRSYPNEDIKNLTIDRAKEIYRADYWDEMNCEAIDYQPLADSIFDFGVNAGRGRSALAIQKACGVKEDGILGPNTMQAINSMNGKYLLAVFALIRIEFYVNLCKNNPSQKKYLYGWTTRALGLTI